MNITDTSMVVPNRIKEKVNTYIEQERIRLREKSLELQKYNENEHNRITESYNELHTLHTMINSRPYNQFRPPSIPVIPRSINNNTNTNPNTNPRSTNPNNRSEFSLTTEDQSIYSFLHWIDEIFNESSFNQGFLNQGINTQSPRRNILSQEEFNNIPTSIYESSNNNDEKCSICQQEYKVLDKLKKLNCTHKFHEHCLQDNLLLHSIEPICPICRCNVRRTS